MRKTGLRAIASPASAAKDHEIREVLPTAGVSTAAHSRLSGSWLGNER